MGNSASHTKLSNSPSSDNISDFATKQSDLCIGLLKGFNGNYKSDSEMDILKSSVAQLVMTLAAYFNENKDKSSQTAKLFRGNIVSALTYAYAKADKDIKTTGVKGNVVKGVIDEALTQIDNFNLKASFNASQKSKSKF